MPSRAAGRSGSAVRTVEELFAGHEDALRLFESVRRALEEIGPADVRVGKGQVGFRRRRGFAWVWRPGQYLHGEAAPLVLTVGLRRRDRSLRWKSVVEPAPGRFTHHLELRSPQEVDDQVRAWLREAWLAAGEEREADARPPVDPKGA